MKFSIIITSYNKVNYIEKCIKSCLEQSEKNFELIVCDNYSDDESFSIFKKYEKFLTLIQKKKISIHAQLNQIDLIKSGLLNDYFIIAFSNMRSSFCEFWLQHSIAASAVFCACPAA